MKNVLEAPRRATRATRVKSAAPASPVESATPAPRPAVVSPLDLTDEHLMQQIQERDSRALGFLHDRYASMLKALIMKVLHNEAESDDMLQEIFVEIWDRASSYSSDKGKALGWIITL
ncbi:MAG TPA: sigma factor, partial [Chthoniobacteraceae bacterium]|nr:sigma factor [Chthoniobacteraceae bacterium]